MQAAHLRLGIFGVLGVCILLPALSSQTPLHDNRIVIATTAALDGRGRVLRNTRIVIENGTIVALDPVAGPVDYDLRGLTVLPGWIDAHVHLTWIFGKDGKTSALERPRRTRHIGRPRMRG